MMDKKKFFLFPLLAALVVFSCNLPERTIIVTATPPPDQPATTVPQEPSPTIAQPTEIASLPPTEALASPTIAVDPATATPSATTLPTATTGPQCTVLQNLNIRPGPGTAYRPPLTSLPKDTIVEPINYNPEGIPGGSWARVRDDTNDLTGWVSAGSQYISCTIDLTTLGSMDVDPPPPPAPPKTGNPTDIDGSCDAPFECIVSVSDQSLIQFTLKRDGNTLTQDTTIKVVQVQFNVTQGGAQVYSRTEANSAYCIFGGDGPCTGWTLSDYVYQWPNGERVENGTYQIEVLADLENDPDSITQIRWAANFTVNVP